MLNFCRFLIVDLIFLVLPADRVKGEVVVDVPLERMGVEEVGELEIKTEMGKGMGKGVGKAALRVFQGPW